MKSTVLLALLAVAGCGNAPPALEPAMLPAAPAAAPQRAAALASPMTISIIGTSDLHGALERLPILAGFIDALRASYESRAGGVVLIDAGDMFQGTLESNLNEGAAVIAAYGAMGYHAAAIGNHELDFGPVGPRSVPESAGDDPQGALKARAREASFPLLAANLAGAAGGELITWPGTAPSALVDVAGVQVGLVGVTTIETPTTTMPLNVHNLRVLPLAEAIGREATSLRQRGAAIIVVAAHAGGACGALEQPDDLSSCEPDAEIFEVARALPSGLVDVIVAGHTHRAVAHWVNGIAVVQGYANGTHFSRVDLTVRAGQVVQTTIFPPMPTCANDPQTAPKECVVPSYAGQAVERSAAVAAVIAPALAAAAEQRAQSLGVRVAAPVERAYDQESALGNLFADLMLAAQPGADVAIINGGGLRADLPAGLLRYGELHRAHPFDNRFARIAMTGSQLEALVRFNLERDDGIFSYSGVLVRAHCRAHDLAIELRRSNGTRITPTERLFLVTSDFLASGGGGAFDALALPPGAIEVGTEPIREAMARLLRRRQAPLSGADAAIDPRKRRRLDFPGQRPVRCSQD